MVWVDEGRVEGSTVFVITLATELLCICHDSIEGKGTGSSTKKENNKKTNKKNKKLTHGADCTVITGKQTNKKKEFREEATK